MKYTLLFALGLPLLAQPGWTSLDVGSPAESACTGTKYTTGIEKQPVPYNSLRFGPTVSCDLPEPNGTCTVVLKILENRPAVATPTIPASGVGLRVFTPSLNGVPSAPIDIVTLVAPLTPYRYALPAASVTDGHLRLSLVASKGNAVLSGLDVFCAPSGVQPPVPPPAPVPVPTPALPITVDPDGSVHVHGNLIIDGFEQSGTPGTPTRFEVTDSAGKACVITIEAGALVLKCP